MNIEYLLLCIFPAIVFIIMLVQIKIAPKGSIHEDFLSLEQSKILQGLAAVGIIFHHLSQYITKFGNEWHGPITIFSSMGILFTTIFFFCSGFGLMQSLKSKPDYLKTFLRKRIPAVLIPFIISNAIYLVLVGMYFGSVNSVLESLACLFGFRLVNTNTWFLVEIMILYLAFYFTHRFIKKPGKAMGAMSIIIVLMITVSLLLGHDRSKDGGLWFMGEWWYNTTIFFLAGLFMAKYYDKVLAFLKKHYKWLLPVSIVAFLATFGLEEFVRTTFGYYQEWEGHPGYGAKAITLLAQTIACATWLLMLLLISMKVRVKNILLVLLGKISLEIYIIHDLFKVFLTYEYERDSLALFIWVILLSIGVAIPLHLIHRLLIRLVTGDRVKISETELSLDKKLELKKKKKRMRELAIVGSIVLVILCGFIVSELYVMLIQPGVYYREEVELLADAEVGDIIPFGTMNTDYVKSGDERILWYVLDRQDDKLLLISVSALSPGEFHNVYEETSWANCSLREMLNGVFYEEYINHYEKELLIETDVFTSDNEEYGTAGGRTVQDYVFLLSAEEVEQYFPNEEDRYAQATQAAARDGANVDINDGYNHAQRDNNTWWWLRNMGADAKKTVVVDAEGDIDYEGRHSTVATGGIKPAMWVSCDGASE